MKMLKPKQIIVDLDFDSIEESNTHCATNSRACQPSNPNTKCVMNNVAPPYLTGCAVY